MNASCKPKIYLALIHFPVINKNGDTVASAVTNLDLHDIARAARTYGVRAFYVVTPVEDQVALVRRILDHWTTGAGGRYNPKRREAVELIRVRESLDAAVADIARETGIRPRTIATAARERSGAIGYPDLRKALGDGKPYLIVFGTAWGLAEEVVTGADHVLEPVQGDGDYNHLSVRTAAAIILDRLLQKW